MEWIDMQTCCMTGLVIIAEKCAAFGRDHRKYMEKVQEEREHLKTCSVCNPSLLAEKLFKSPVVVTRS